MKERKLHLFVLAGIVLLILWWAGKRARANNTVTVRTDETPSVPSLGYGEGSGTPGMPSENWYYGRGANSLVIKPGDVNVNLHVDPWSSLSDKYIPLFGFVGIATGPGAYQ